MISDDELSNIEARSDVYRLVAEVRRLRTENQRLRGEREETTAPKLKIGDRVRYVGQHPSAICGCFGTVRGYSATGAWVEFDYPHTWSHSRAALDHAFTKLGRCWWCGDDDLELVEHNPDVARHPLPTTSVVSHEQPVRDTQAPLLIDECEEQRAMATMAAKEGGE